MKNSNGGILGVAVTPNSEAPDAVQSGIWNLQDVATYEAQGKWAQPNVGPNASPIVSDPSTIVWSQGNTQLVAFSGATDFEDNNNNLKYEIVNISNTSAITNVTGADTASPFQFTFTAGSVSQNETVTFDVKVTDSYGATDTKVGMSLTVTANAVPNVSAVAITSGSTSFAEGQQSTLTFAGATDAEDTDTTLTYELVNFEVGSTSFTPGTGQTLTAVSPSSDSSSPFQFTLTGGLVSADTAVTFDVKVTDSGNASSTKENFSVTVLNEVTLSLGSYSHNSHYYSSGTVNHVIGSINVPSGLTLDKFFVNPQSNTTNPYHTIYRIKIGSTTIWEPDIGYNTWNNGVEVEYNVAALSISSGAQNVSMDVRSIYEYNDRIYLDSMTFIFN